MGAEASVQSRYCFLLNQIQTAQVPSFSWFSFLTSESGWSPGNPPNLYLPGRFFFRWLVWWTGKRLTKCLGHGQLNTLLALESSLWSVVLLFFPGCCLNLMKNMQFCSSLTKNVSVSLRVFLFFLIWQCIILWVVFLPIFLLRYIFILLLLLSSWNISSGTWWTMKRGQLLLPINYPRLPFLLDA